MPKKLRFAVSRVSLIFQERFPDAASRLTLAKYSLHIVHQVTHSNSNDNEEYNFKNKNLTTKKLIMLHALNYLSLVVRKPVFGVSDQVPHKSGCTATEDGWRLEISYLGRREIVLSV